MDEQNLEQNLKGTPRPEWPGWKEMHLGWYSRHMDAWCKANPEEAAKDWEFTHCKFIIGDKAYKPKGYKFPCTIVGIFKTTNEDIRVVGEMDDYGLLHIFNEGQLEHYETKN